MYFVDECLAVPDRNILIVNSELTKIKITVVTNLKWQYPCYPVGRAHFTFGVTTKLYIPLVQLQLVLVLTTARIGWL